MITLEIAAVPVDGIIESCERLDATIVGKSPR